MCQLLETIKVENRKFVNINYHQLRMNKSYAQIFGKDNVINLSKVKIPSNVSNDLHRCRIVYSTKIEKIEFIKQEKRKFMSLKLVHCNEISYNHKYANREHLITLLREAINSDEIIIVKNGLVTDCSIGNLIFKKNDKWYTPYKPLLEGTQRQRLIDIGQIIPIDIKETDLLKYESLAIINALIDFKSKQEIFIKNLDLA